MSNATKGLKPELVWKYFAAISRIPRCSKNERAVSNYVLETAKKLGLEAEQDAALNVLARKPASPGRQSQPPVCLQGHLDMVGEKNKDKVHDFSKDPIELVRRGDVMMANGTTLGADNGIAVATNLAIMEDKSLEHGPLEFLFTVDEETGLTGANSLAPGWLRSRTLLNLDSEEEGALYVGCSGGRDTTGTWVLDVDPAPSGSTAVTVKVGGLKGGHSGLEIDKGRGNAIKILNRVVMRLSGVGGRMSRIDGGNKRNAIPREAEAVVYVPRAKMTGAAATAEEMNATVKAEFATVEPDLMITLEPAAPSRGGKVVKMALQKKLTRTIAALPHGVIRVSADIPGLVETSTNLAVISTSKKAVSIATSQRSSVASEIVEITDSVRAAFELGGAAVTGSDGYPGWKPNLDSAILQLAKSTYRSLYGRDPEVKAVHAGLECGIIGEKYPGMDMVSFGPTLEAVHSPDEKLHIDSVGKFWTYLLEILKNAR